MPTGRNAITTACSSWIPRTVAEAADLGPADDSGLAWSAVGLHVTHPDRPHRLVVTVTGGDPSALGVAIVDPGGSRPACQSFARCLRVGASHLEGRAARHLFLAGLARLPRSPCSSC